MTMQDILRSAALALLLATAPALAQDAAAPAETAGQAAPAAAAQEYAPQKAVYHINYPGSIDGSGYKPALNNLVNHLNAVGEENLDLRVVMHGDGLGLLAAANKDQALQATISDLKARGCGSSSATTRWSAATSTRKPTCSTSGPRISCRPAWPRSPGCNKRALSISSPDARPLDRPLQGGGGPPILSLSGFARTMDINAQVISGSDPGAVPGGSTIHPSLGANGAETGSTNV